jgi:hypothetical protein
LPGCGTRDIQSRRRRINPNKETMGSTPSGNARPIRSAALPQHIKTDRDGASRVKMGGRA